MNWSQLSPEEAAKFLSAVAGNGDPTFFEPSLCEVHKLDLPFYDGYALVRIVNKHSIPYLLLDYLSNGEQHYYLDGSERGFHNVNAQGALSLNEQNVGLYIDLFISYVYERGNSLIFLHDRQSEPPKYNAQTGMYEQALPLLYQDKEVMSRIEINAEGQIFVREPIEVSFLTELHPDTANPYRHPCEVEIIEQSKALLSVSETGRALLKNVETVTVRVLSAPDYRAFVTNASAAYIAMPGAEQNAKYTQALMLAGVLRDLQQVKDGYIHAHPVADKALYTVTNYGKNLDILLQMCKIVEEYEAQNIPEPLDMFKKMGFGLVYDAYKNGSREEALMETYITALEQNNMLEGK